MSGFRLVGIKRNGDWEAYRGGYADGQPVPWKYVEVRCAYTWNLLWSRGC